MSGNSRPVASSQAGIHPSLAQVVHRHLLHRWRQPVAQHNLDAFRLCDTWRRHQGFARPLMLDSGCGTGRSSRVLAMQHPEALVIGIDQSAVRLQRGLERFGAAPANLYLMRAECADIWRLMLEADWSVVRHFLLYPNPWPKPGHLQRRWHGHPVFPQLLALSDVVELRTNWQVYAEEMGAALSVAGRPAGIERIRPEAALTDFEEKYRDSGHALWRLLSCRV
ncbi:MAG: SAM-dependent methyltransferase [Alcanivoracaceae bacterium]|nr:SAM-dependent methyltransferase [Alcanivoracaceae bacterium]